VAALGAVLQTLLKHDKPMHRKGGHVPHLRHLPAYLRDPTTNANELAAAGAAAAAAAQRQPKQKGPKAKKQAAAGAAQDPLKAAAGAAGTAAAPAPGGGSTAAAAAAAAAGGLAGSVFVKAAKKSGSAVDEELTELERRAIANPLKLSKAKVLAGVGGAAVQAKVLGTKAAALAQGAFKRNVKAVRPTTGAGAKRRR
jgi:hypothetical protein